MLHVIGLSPANQERLAPLRAELRLRFDLQDSRSAGYFTLLAEVFEPFAHRDSGQSLFSINTLVVLKGTDLRDAMQLLSESEERISSFPRAWREYVGEVWPARDQLSIRIEPLLFRRRALQIIGRLRLLMEQAQQSGDLLAFGNGVTYRTLCGIPSPPGTVVYS